MPQVILIAVLLLASLTAGPEPTPTSPTASLPDPGMWTFDNLPLEHLKKTYGFEPTSAWIDHVRLSSVRVSTGGSGSFVSPHGLVMTNHHVALELVNSLSTEESDLVEAGFHAREHDEELKCPGAELVQLVLMKDVTAEVEEAAADAGSAAQATRKRAQAINAINQRMSSDTGLRVEVVTLYGGGQFVAYGYKVYDDIRLVFAPEMRVAYFGGDFDNFCYPRWCLDAAFLRAWENGKPADTSGHYFRWSPKGPSKEELVFVSGNPGSTARLWPLSRLRHERDHYNPGILTLLRRREKALVRYAATGAAQRIKVLDELFSARNSIKAYEGQQGGLLDLQLWGRKEKEEEAFRKAAAGNEAVAQAFATFDASRQLRDSAFVPLVFLRIDGDLGALAIQVARMGTELARPEDERPESLKGEALKEAIERIVKSRDIDRSLEIERLHANLDNAVETLGRDHVYVRTAVGSKDTRAAAEEAVNGSVLLRPDDLRQLLEGGAEAINGSDDILIKLARAATPLRNRARASWAKAQSDESEAGGVLAKARFKIYGNAVYPDATFTLRLTYGTCKGYELGTTKVPWKTTLYGLFARNAAMDGEKPFNLPERWVDAKPHLDLSTPYNFVSTTDIIGGNSGSPVINKDLEIVGLIFDGNIQSLPNRYLYLDEVCRSVSVHSEGIKHALERVYKTYGLLAELGIR